jgi:hypothetical protein
MSEHPWEMLTMLHMEESKGHGWQVKGTNLFYWRDPCTQNVRGLYNIPKDHCAAVLMRILCDPGAPYAAYADHIPGTLCADEGCDYRPVHNDPA